MKFIISIFDTVQHNNVIRVHDSYIDARRSINGFRAKDKWICGIDSNSLQKYPIHPKRLVADLIEKDMFPFGSAFQIARFTAYKGRDIITICISK
jgi:hypothetical protein